MATLPITNTPELTAVDKPRITLDMAEAGADMMRENLRRRHPDEDASGLERRLVAWLHERPGDETGDADGVPGRRRFDAA